MASSVVKWLLAACLLAFVAIGAGCSQSGGKKQENEKKAVSAHVIEIKPRTIILDKHYASLLRSPGSVDVVARVSGLLEKRFYDAGDYVKKGQKLFTIEPAPYEAKVQAARANLASAKAHRHKTALNWRRISTLFQRHAVSEQARDNAKAALETAKAAVKQTRAALDQAKIQLGYTTVEAPASGQVGLRQVNTGNFVQPPKVLTTITPLDPIDARFALPVRDAGAIRKQRREENGSATEARLRGDGGQILRGKLNFLGSRVNRQTGTVTARATFQNPQHAILPGQYAEVYLLHLRMPNMIAVPQVAVTEGQEGTRVYVLDEHDKVKPITIETGKRTHTGWVIVKDGLKPGMKVVVNHISKVEAGTKIKPERVPANPNKPFPVKGGESSGNKKGQHKAGSAG